MRQVDIAGFNQRTHRGRACNLAARRLGFEYCEYFE